MITTAIRRECLNPAHSWVRPTGDEIKEVMRLAGLSGAQAAAKLGLGVGGGRTVRRWLAKDYEIPYAAWALLCYFAGLGLIFNDQAHEQAHDLA